MIQLNLARVLILGDETTGLVRYEIFSKEGERPDYPEKIIVYREQTSAENGNKYWAITDDVISLEHLGPQHRQGFQQVITYSMPASRDISAAIGECRRHYRENVSAGCR